MKRKKPGFSLGEVLITLMVVGIIMALSMQTIKIVRASYTSLTYFAFENIKMMVGEIYAGRITAEGNESGKSVLMCKKSDGMSTYIINPDVEIVPNSPIKDCKQYNEGTTHVFCNKLVDISNTSGRTYCNNLYTATVGEAGEAKISDLDVKNPTFITTNGFRYYLTEHQYNANVSDDYGFRLMAVDINGTNSPNIANPEGKVKAADIVTFLIMDNGEVFPVGIAANNVKDGTRTIQYLNSKLKGYYYSFDPNRTEGIPAECYLKGQQSCNYAVVYIGNEANNNMSTYSYREAYCKSLGARQSVYKTYCNGIAGHFACPPSNNEQRFDLCLVENIKPMFRYNFNR